MQDGFGRESESNMSGCCSDHNKKDRKEKEEMRVEKTPKSYIGKYLYKLGKEEVENGMHKKKGCFLVTPNQVILKLVDISCKFLIATIYCNIFSFEINKFKTYVKRETLSTPHFVKSKEKK